MLDECIYNINQRHEVVRHHEMAASISQCLLIPAFFDVSCGGDIHGIFGQTPFEILHTLLLGVMKYSLQCIFEHGSDNTGNQSSSTPITKLDANEFE